MIDPTRISATPPTSGAQTPSPVGGRQDATPKPFDVVPAIDVPADRTAVATPEPTHEGDVLPSLTPDDQSAYEGPRHVTQGFMHEETGRYVIRVVASLNPDDVIAQYPPENLLRFYELARELQAQSTAPEFAENLGAA